MPSKRFSSFTPAPSRRGGKMDVEDQFEHEEAEIALEQRQVDIDKRRLELKRRRKAMFHRTEIDLTEDSDEDIEERRVRVKQEIKREEPMVNSTSVQKADADSARGARQDEATDTAEAITDAPPTTVAPDTPTVTPASINPTIPPVVQPYCFVDFTPALMQGQQTSVLQNPVLAAEPSVQAIPKPAEFSHTPHALSHMTPKRTLEQSSPDERDHRQSMSTNAAIPAITRIPPSKRQNRRSKPPRGIVHDYWNSLKRYFENDAGLEVPQVAAFEKLTLLYSQRFGKRPDADTPKILHERFDEIVVERDGGGPESWPLLPLKLQWISSFSHVWWPACKSIPKRDDCERLMDKVIRDITEHKYNEEEYHQIASTGRMPI